MVLSAGDDCFGVCSQCKKRKALGCRYVKTTNSYKAYAMCPPCRTWQADHYQSTREDVLAKTKTVGFKKARNERLASNANKAKVKALAAHPESVARRQAILEENTDAIREKQKIYRNHPDTKKKRQEWWAKPGVRERVYAQPSRIPSRKRRHDKIRNDPGLKLQERLRGSLGDRLSGKLRDEPTSLPKFTEFKTVEDIVKHFSMRLASKPGMTLDNYGSFWSIGHIIPVAWYNSSNLEDVRRCNSKMNLDCDYNTYPTPTGELTNYQKSTALPSDAEMLSMVDCFPVAWDGKLPSSKLRKSMMQKFHGPGGRASKMGKRG